MARTDFLVSSEPAKPPKVSVRISVRERECECVLVCFGSKHMTGQSVLGSDTGGWVAREAVGNPL